MKIELEARLKGKAFVQESKDLKKPDNKLKSCVFKRPEKHDGPSHWLVEGIISYTDAQSSTGIT